MVGQMKARKKQTKRPVRKGLTTKGKGRQVNDVAGVSETFPFNTTQSGTIYVDYTTSLFQHDRARVVASGYQEFRIKLVEYRFKAYNDTFLAGGATTLPYLYYIIDRNRANNGMNTIDAFKAAGAKPIRLDDKTIVVKFRPAVLYDNYDANTLTSIPRSYKLSPWLTTNDNSTNPASFFQPSEVDHTGIRWVVECNTGTIQYQVERIVHIEFRKPMWIEAPPAESQLQVVDVYEMSTKPKTDTPPEPPVEPPV